VRIASVGLAIAAVAAGIASFVTGVPVTLGLSCALASFGCGLLRHRVVETESAVEIQQELAGVQS